MSKETILTVCFLQIFVVALKVNNCLNIHVYCYCIDPCFAFKLNTPYWLFTALIIISSLSVYIMIFIGRSDCVYISSSLNNWLKPGRSRQYTDTKMLQGEVVYFPHFIVGSQISVLPYIQF